MSEPLLPLFLKLSGRRVLLVGGGRVAAAKLPALLGAGADVTVVAPEIADDIASSGARVARRGFEPADLEGAWLVVAAAPPEVNARVAAEAERYGVFVNAVDDPTKATAYAGGVVRRGEVTVAVSTNGAAPALAGLLREALEALLPQDLEAWAVRAHELRRPWKSEGVPLTARRPLLLDALNALYGIRGLS